MLEIEKRSDFRRASLISEFYSENQGGGAPKAATSATGTGAATTTTALSASDTGNQNGKKVPGAGKPPPIPGMRRKVPKGKFGIIGLGKVKL